MKPAPVIRPSDSRPKSSGISGTGSLLLATVLAALASGQVEARPSYGTDIDSFCIGFNGSTPNADQGCDLCHSNDYGEYISPAWDWYFDPQQWHNFCGPAAVNEPPVLTPIGNQTVDQLETLSFTVTAIDPDSNNISLTASGLPSGASFNANGGSGQFRWTPNAQQSGNFPVTFTATDDGDPVESDSEQITISVGVPNRPPVLDAIGPQSATIGVELSLTVTASDPDGDGLTLSAANLPSGANFIDNRDGSGSFRWTPQAGQEGDHPILFSVVDNGVPQGKDSEEVTVTIAGGNSTPVLAPIGNQTARIGELLEIKLSASDADGDQLSFAVGTLPNRATFSDNGDGTALFRWTPPAAIAAQQRLTFSVSDDHSPPASDSETISITIGDSNQPPVLAAIGKHSVLVGQLLEIALSASDPDGDALSFAAAPLPVGAELIDNSDGTAVLRWMPAADQAGNHALSISVSDDGSPQASDAEDIGISVRQQDVAPAEVKIRRAVYRARRDVLVIAGRGTPGTLVTVSDADSDRLLGSAEVDQRKRWKLKLRGIGLAPCRVVASSLSASAEAEVRGARGCDEDDNDHDDEHEEHDRDDDRKDRKDRKDRGDRDERDEDEDDD